METILAPIFEPFQKIPRLKRDCVITEKIDGTNALIKITEEGGFYVGSRTRWITPEDDNYGFATWAQANKDELLKLGVGSHYGEWWGPGIQRRYGVAEKRFSLFNTARWEDPALRPTCCHVVPVIATGCFGDMLVDSAIEKLRTEGSLASPGFMLPEGIVIYHTASRLLFKKTLLKDEEHKDMRPK